MRAFSANLSKASLWSVRFRYSVQRAAHQEVLSGFERELHSLEGVVLHPSMQSNVHKTLLDLIDAPRLREWAGRCLACHQSLVQKASRAGASVNQMPLERAEKAEKQSLQVAGLEELFAALKADVEAVFMQGPSVQLEARATQLQAMKPHIEGLVGMMLQLTVILHAWSFREAASLHSRKRRVAATLLLSHLVICYAASCYDVHLQMISLQVNGRCVPSHAIAFFPSMLRIVLSS